jgi:hypothetical protein
MTKREMIAEMREILARDAKRPASERIAGMIARGAIDSRGRVLVRGPGHNAGSTPPPAAGMSRRPKAQ